MRQMRMPGVAAMAGFLQENPDPDLLRAFVFHSSSVCLMV
jgi:hypothetical protein